MELSDVEDGNNDKEEEEDEEEEQGGEDDLDAMDDDILNDPDFQNMSDSEGDDLPLFENLSEDEMSGDEEGTYRYRFPALWKNRNKVEVLYTYLRSSGNKGGRQLLPPCMLKLGGEGGYKIGN